MSTSRLLRPGFCGVTTRGGNCSAGQSGSLRLCPSPKAQEESAAPGAVFLSALAACHARCRSCHQCRYVSFSIERGDCSWFARCPQRLRHDVGGFYTVETAAWDASDETTQAVAVAALVAGVQPPALVRKGGPQSRRKKLRVLVAFYGALNRGVLLSGPSLREQLVAPLRSAPFVQKVHVLCTGLDSAQMDGVRVCGHAGELLGCDELLTHPEADVLGSVARLCNASAHACTFSHWFYRREQVTQRAMVQLHEENRVAWYLREHGHRYDLVVVSSPDLYLVRPIVLADVQSVALAGGSVVLTGGTNDWFGYQNGWYAGKPRDVALITNRFEDAPRYRRPWVDYEGLLRSAFEHHGVQRRVTPLYFFKVRATCQMTMHADPEKLVCTPELDDTRRRFRAALGRPPLRKEAEHRPSCSCPEPGSAPGALYAATRPLLLGAVMQAQQDDATVWVGTAAAVGAQEANVHVTVSTAACHLAADWISNDGWADMATHRACWGLAPCRSRLEAGNGDATARDVLFVSTELIPQHESTLLAWPRPFVLLSSSNDDQPSGLSMQLLASPQLLRWYGTFAGVVHPKFRPLPLGPKWYSFKRRFFSENTTLQCAALHAALLQQRPPCSSIGSRKRQLLFASFTDWTTASPMVAEHRGTREQLRRVLRRGGMVHASTHLPKGAYYRTLAQSTFCLAPPGRGPDSHRLWEALMFNCIPVVLDHAPQRALWRGLPVLAVRSWEELLSAGGNVSEYLEARRRELRREFGGAIRGAGCLSALPRAYHRSVWRADIQREFDPMPPPSSTTHGGRTQARRGMRSSAFGL
eukprot:scaffold129766_cov69-Phaeocystis_antarctica.AAC.3